jgi:hypothetical protein
MHHGIGAFLDHDLDDAIPVAQVAFGHPGARIHRIAMAAFEAVKHHHFVTLVQQEFRGDTADVTGAACDENFHRSAMLIPRVPGI